MASPSSRLDALVRGAPDLAVMCVVAHPDDETIFAGATLADRPRACIVHLTDGSPRDPWFARRVGIEDRERYAALRRHELDAALRVLGLERARRIALGAPDQEAHTHAIALVEALARVVAEVRPDVVLAHAYDGGHPDHDTAAFVARAALARSGTGATLIDLAGYHEREPGRAGVGFLPRGGPAIERVLELEQRRRKDAALACFASQRDVIATLETGVERFRVASREDFGVPPHAGTLHYERHGWDVDGARFRAEIARAARALELPTVLP